MRISDWSSDVCSSDLARQHRVAELDQVDVGLAALREHALAAHFLLMDMVLDLFGQHLDLGIEEIVGRVAFLYVVDQQLGAVMLDIGLVQRIVLYPAAKGDRKSVV